MKVNKKLIEVGRPVDSMNTAAAQEKGNPFLKGHPRNLHQWWSRKPTATARAVIFAQMVDDPSAHPDLFPTEKKQEKERQRLFKIIEDLVKWENTTNETVLQQAREAIWQSWRYACAENADHPNANELFNRHKLPKFHDPFAGGGALPLEAQRLGLEPYASDLNPVAVIINKALIEFPAKFAGKPPVNPESRRDMVLIAREWSGSQGLAADLRYYSQRMRDEAENRMGYLYPKVEVTLEMTKHRPDLRDLVGQKLTATAFLWARTVKSPDPAFSNVNVPLASTFTLSAKAGKEAYIEPLMEGGNYQFTVSVGRPKDAEAAKNGTKVGRGGHFQCLMSGSPIHVDYIRQQGQAGNLGTRLMAIVADGPNGREYLSPDAVSEKAASAAVPLWKPDQEINHNPRDIRTQLYGLTKYSDLFTPRQLVALTTFSELVQQTRDLVMSDAIDAGLFDDHEGIAGTGNGASAYADAISVLEALALDKLVDYSNTACTWNPTNQNVSHLFTKQAIPIAWGFTEVWPLGGGLSFDCIANGIASAIEVLPAAPTGIAFQGDASATLGVGGSMIYSLDPPYYDNIGYADLSDFFYVWLRRSLKPMFPDLFATVVVPKAEELVATPYRHGSKEKAELFFIAGMTRAMQRIVEQAHPAFPVTIYYAFKQSETESAGEGSTIRTGWDTFLEAVISAGFAITGTWPMRTERNARSNAMDSNSLASSIVLVCRKRAVDAPIATRRDFVTTLKAELPAALINLQRGNIAPVDLAQAAIGPGMAIYTRYAKVLDAEGNPLPVREALSLINQTLDEALAEQEGDFDADSRWALAWFEQSGFAEGEYGVAEILSKAKNTSVAGMVEAGILASSRGKVRLLKPEELPKDWDPETDKRLTAWEMVHHLIRVLESGGETLAAALATKLGSKAESARELCYRLYRLCERKKRANEALSYNALVQSWPEITRLAREGERSRSVQGGLFTETER